MQQGSKIRGGQVVMGGDNVSPPAHRTMRAKNFPFLYEDGPRTVMGVKW